MRAEQERSESEALAISERGWLCLPCPLLSRQRVVLASSGATRGLVRGSGALTGWRAEADGEAWVEVRVGVGPARVLVRLEAPRWQRLPARYRIESAVLDREVPGVWRPELDEQYNALGTRTHVVEFDGQSTLRVVFEPGEERAALARFDVHDASDGTDDVWLVLGGPLASLGLSEHGGARGFAEGVQAVYPGYFPAVIDESWLGASPAHALANLDELLRVHRDVRRVALCFGGAWPEPLSVAALEELARRLLTAGRIPLFSRVPVLADSPPEVASAFNARLEALELELGLARGPDLSAWAAKWLPGGLTDPTTLEALPAEARDALSALWVEAADVFYVPV